LSFPQRERNTHHTKAACWSLEPSEIATNLGLEAVPFAWMSLLLSAFNLYAQNVRIGDGSLFAGEGCVLYISCI
jgi:hypothetical protein